MRSKVSPQVTTVDTTTVTTRDHIISEVISQLISQVIIEVISCHWNFARAPIRSVVLPAREMDTKDIVVFLVLLLCYSLILIKCVGNELSKVARELADTQNELLRKLPEELLVKGQLKRLVRQADEDTDMLSATEILSNARDQWGLLVRKEQRENWETWARKVNQASEA